MAILKGQLSCRCCGMGGPTLKLSIAIYKLLELLDDDYIIYVTSCYRCRKHNNSLPTASKTSYHMEGMAVDIACNNLDVIGLYGVVSSIEEFDNGGIGVYFGEHPFIHADIRRGRKRFAYKNGESIPWGELEEFGIE